MAIYDQRLVGNKYDIACFPSKFFHKLVKDGRVRFNEKGRPIFDFFVSPMDGYPKYTLRLKPGKRYGRGPRADVVEFFLSDGTTFRQAFQHCGAWEGEVRFAPHR